MQIGKACLPGKAVSLIHQRLADLNTEKVPVRFNACHSQQESTPGTTYIEMQGQLWICEHC
jgi:hypothetical protein